MNATLGIRMPVILGFTVSIEADYQYDGGAVEGDDDLDERELS